MEWIVQELTNTWLAAVNFLSIDPSRLLHPEMIARLCLQLMLLLGSAFFSGSETALFSLSRLDLQRVRRERNRHSETLHALLDQPRRLIISILCGNELINIAAATNMAGILVALYGEDRAGLINVLVMVPLILLFGEVTPKTVAVSNPLRVSTGIVAGPMSVWVRLIAPLRWIIRGVSDRVTTLMVGEEKAKDNILQIDEFRSLVEEVAQEGELSASERALIHNLLEAGDTEIVEIMTPRTRTRFINAKLSVPEMVEQLKAYRHSRIPVFREHRDRLIGFIHAEDILALVLKDTDLMSVSKKQILRPPIVVPLTKTVDEMFDFFQKNEARAAVVLNEFGGVEGFITMQDVLNFIFAQIAGDVEGQEFYHERDENVYEVPGEMKLTDFNNLSNFGIEDPRMTTVGGIAFRHLDRLPKVGDKVIIDEFVMTVLAMDEHRIARVRVVRGLALDEDLEEMAREEEAAGEVAAAADPAPAVPVLTDLEVRQSDHPLVIVESALLPTAVEASQAIREPAELEDDGGQAEDVEASEQEQQREQRPGGPGSAPVGRVAAFVPGEETMPRDSEAAAVQSTVRRED